MLGGINNGLFLSSFGGFFALAFLALLLKWAFANRTKDKRFVAAPDQGIAQNGSTLFDFRARNFHGPRIAHTVGCQKRGEVFGRAGHQLVAFGGDFFLYELRVFQNAGDFGMQLEHDVARRGGWHKQAKPGVRRHIGKARFGEGGHLGQQGQAGFAADGQRFQLACLDVHLRRGHA